MPIKQREILKLAERVESLTNQMDELEYEKNVTKRMRNVILREFGKRVEDLKVEPFEVMLKKVQDKAIEVLTKELGEELNKNIEVLIIELMKDFRKEFNEFQEEKDKENKGMIGDFRKEISEMNNILEKKVALMEEDLFKRTNEIDDNMEGLSKSVREVMKDLRIKVSAMKNEMDSHSDKLKKLEEESAKSGNKLEGLEKDVGAIDLEKEIGYLDRRFGQEIDSMKKEVKELRSFNKTLMDKDITKIWDKVDSIEKGTEVDSKKMKAEIAELKEFKLKRKTAIPEVVTKIEMLEKKVEKIEPKKVDKGLDRIDELERLVNEALKAGKGGKK